MTVRISTTDGKSQAGRIKNWRYRYLGMTKYINALVSFHYTKMCIEGICVLCVDQRRPKRTPTKYHNDRMQEKK